MRLVKLDTRLITDWDTFHDAFAETFGFPTFYGRNMDAWIDCMTWLDDPSAEMSRVHSPPGGVVVLELEHVDGFISRCPEQYGALVECAAFVNWRKIEVGEPAVLALFYKHS
jgi:barstar (barnase inhibitor)